MSGAAPGTVAEAALAPTRERYFTPNLSPRPSAGNRRRIRSPPGPKRTCRWLCGPDFDGRDNVETEVADITVQADGIGLRGWARSSSSASAQPRRYTRTR